MNEHLRHFLVWCASQGMNLRDERAFSLYCWKMHLEADAVAELEGLRARHLFDQWANDEGRSTNNADFPDSYYYQFAEEWEAERGTPLNENEWDAIL